MVTETIGDHKAPIFTLKIPKIKNLEKSFNTFVLCQILHPSEMIDQSDTTNPVIPNPFYSEKGSLAASVVVPVNYIKFKNIQFYPLQSSNTCNRIKCSPYHLDSHFG